MFEEMNWFAMADDLEAAKLDLNRTSDLLLVLEEGVFKNGDLQPYYRQYEAVLDAALDKVLKQSKIISEIVLSLYEFNKECKGA